MSARILRVRNSSGVGEEGSALVEFALSVILLMMLMFGIFQATLALYSDLLVSEVARSGARYAIVRGSTSGSTDCSADAWANCAATAADVANYVKNLGYPIVDSSKITVSTTWLTPTGGVCSGTCNSPGNQVRVKVNYPYSMAMPFVSMGTLNLAGTSQMVIQQ